MTISLKLALPLALVVCASLNVQPSRADNFLERTLDRQVDKMKFEDWARNHPDWVAAHPDRYQFFLHHPEDAERLRAEWAGERTERIEFAQWASQHPDWVETHHDRYDLFIHHPDEAERYRSEWVDWHADHVDHVERIEFKEWASRHPDWVAAHPDRYRYFLDHPDQAEHFRHEWADLH